MAPRAKQLVAEFDDLKEEAARARLPYDKDILLNLAFFLDQQYAVWNSDAQAIEIARRPNNRRSSPRPVTNKIMHFVLKQRATALETHPTVDVLPATDDPVDMSVASVALAYLRWLSEPQVADIDGELSEATLWALAGGEGYLKWGWNSDEKRGDVTACAPTEIFVDPYARRFKGARYIIHEQFLDVHQVEKMYGKKVSPTTTSKADVAKAALLRDMGMAPVLEGVLVNELWVKPGVDQRWPDGLFVVWAGNEILVEAQPFPYQHGKLPFTIIGAIPRPGSPHYTCTVKYLRSPQMELNKYHAQRISVREAFASPKWWLPTELELEADPDDSPNQILRGNSSSGLYRPEIIQPSVFPENTDGQWIREEMMDVAGQHETSQGRVPGRVEAARAIEMLKQADDSHLAELTRTISSSLADGYWQLLMLAKQYGPEKTIVQTYSREGIPEVRRFMKEEIKPGMRVRVLMGSGLATTRAARQDQALLMWQNGIITDPEVMADLLDIPVGTLTPQKVYDVRLARNENLMMIEGEDEDGHKGTAKVPNSWDDHDIHIREHNNFRKTSEFEALPNDVKQKFEFHVQTHKDLRMKAMQEQLEEQALAMQAQGMPAPGAQPPTEGEEPAEPPAPGAMMPPGA